MITSSAPWGKPRENASSLPEHTSTDYDSDRCDGLPSPLALISQTKSVSGTDPDNDSLKAFDPSQLDDDESNLKVTIELSNALPTKEDS